MDRQQEFFMIGPTRPTVMVDEKVIKHVPSMREAIRLCIHLSGYTQNHISEALGIDKGHMSRILSGDAHFDHDLLPDLMSLCGNYAPLQFLAKAHRFTLQKQTDKERELATLRDRIDKLEAAL